MSATTAPALSQLEIPYCPPKQWCRCRRCGRKLRVATAINAGIGKRCARKEAATNQDGVEQ